MRKVNRQIIFCLLIVFAFCVSKQGYAQNIDLENFYKPNLKVTGVVNANLMYYNTNQPNPREPFTYLLSGNLNISAFSFSVPLFYSITNQGDHLGYTAPFDFNRLSIMPKYKWIKAYIGNANMTFSPYTLSGFPFKGVGLELTPNSLFKVSVMGGQLLKAVSAEEALGGIPVYERFGYGARFDYQKTKYKLGWITFYAKDNENSITPIIEDKDVTPKENWVNSLIFNTSIIKSLNFNVEYALSVLTDDSRAKTISGGNFRDKLFSAKESTSYLNALNVNFDYSIQKSVIGLTYERIDPNYSTLGALYFNNDLENISLRFSRPFYNDKIMVATSLGYQRDDLAKEKKQDTKRIVGSINMNYKISEQINFTGNYSNFSTYTNKKLDQFELINNPNVVAADTLDYRQLSQNASFNISYVFGKKKNQNLNLNYNIAGQANEQGGIIRRGQASNIQNYNLAHSINFTDIKTNLNSSLNYTNNQVGLENNYSMGASVGVSKKLLKDKLNANFGILYNNSQSSESATSVFGAKFNTSFMLLERHNFNMSIISMFRSNSKSEQVNDLSATFNYSYSIDKIKLPERKESKKKNIVSLEPILKINYKEEKYEGTRNEIFKQLKSQNLELLSIPDEDLKNLEHLRDLVNLTPDEKSFKEKALEYLKTYDSYNSISKKYNQYIFETIKSLEKEMMKRDETFESEYTSALGRVNKHKLHGGNLKTITNKTQYKSYLKLVERKNQKEKPLKIHRWMQNEMKTLMNIPIDSMFQNVNLSNFKKQELGYFFKMIKNQKKETEIIQEIKMKLLPFYHDLAIQHYSNQEVEVIYLKK